MAIERREESDLEPSLHHFFINFRTMELRLRILTAVVTAQVAASALLLLLQNTPWHIDLPATPFLDKASIPSIHYGVSCIFVFAGVLLFANGLIAADWRGAVRLLFVLGVAY